MNHVIIERVHAVEVLEHLEISPEISSTRGGNKKSFLLEKKNKSIARVFPMLSIQYHKIPTQLSKIHRS